MKITNLTDNQVAMIPAWVDKWVRVGLSTESADFEVAERAARCCYSVAQLQQPLVVLHMGSPYSTVLGGMYATLLVQSQVESQIQSQIWSQIWSQIGAQIGSQVGARVQSQIWSQVQLQVQSQVQSQVGAQVVAQVVAQVESQVGAQIGSQVVAQVWSQVGAQIGSQVQSQVWSQVGAQIWSQVQLQVQSQVGAQVQSQVQLQVQSQVGAQVQSQVESQVGAQVQSQVQSQVGAQVKNILYQYRGCQLWAGWYAYISFFRDVCGWKGKALANYAHDEQLALSCGWSWWHTHVCALSDRPQLLKRNARGQLHSATGPALLYPDGWALWSLNGVIVSHVLVDTPADQLDVKRWVVMEENAEVRREAVRKIGIERICVELKATVIERGTDQAGQPCELLLLATGDGRKRPYIKLRNPSIGVYHIEGVPPNCTTIEAAFQFRNGQKGVPEWIR